MNILVVVDFLDLSSFVLWRFWLITFIGVVLTIILVVLDFTWFIKLQACVTFSKSSSIFFYPTTPILIHNLPYTAKQPPNTHLHHCIHPTRINNKKDPKILLTTPTPHKTENNNPITHYLTQP
ncbi:hypothetical protein Lalb_Chr07g0177761 [Lupinus albus]|uniref:Transmembrane protein n=1 Tax=Lupinus albus TaxID=3870 RepID=A0A6A4Q749_LUPAL|nr:hypothetical protein Lalb_Chr07g0177761 [Lupinus albus]